MIEPIRLFAVDESMKQKSSTVIYAGASSQDLKDGLIIPEGSKKRLVKRPRSWNDVNQPPEGIERFDYFWLKFDSSHKFIPHHQRWGVIAASLLEGEIVKPPIAIYIDGKRFGKGAKDYAKGCITEVTGLENDYITFYNDVDFDRRVPAVNMAGKIAYWELHRKRDIDEIESDSHRKKILIDLVKS
jgi:hypothetical protein